MNDDNSIFTDIKTDEIEASHFQRAVADILDWVIDVAFTVVFYLLLPKEMFANFIKSTSFGIYIIVIVIMFLYRLLAILVFNKTAGMMICRIKYLNADLKPLSAKEKLIAVFVLRTSRIKYYKT